MFPFTSDHVRPATRSAWARIRDAVDLVIAFMTLDSYGIDDLPHGRRLITDGPVVALADGSAGACADGPAGAFAMGPVAAADASAAGPTAGRRAIAARPPTDPAPRTRTATGTELPADVRPHRGELRARSRPRRPGSLEPAEQLCLTPLAPLAERATAAGPGPLPSRCRPETPDTRDA